MLTKAQKLMVADGFPAKLFLTAAQRSATWTRNSKIGINWTHSFKDPKEDKFREASQQIEQEIAAAQQDKTTRRITKMLAGQTRKALAQEAKRAIRRGQRWDSRHNRWEPNDEEMTMRCDDPKLPADEATTAVDLISSVANEETVMAKLVKKSPKKSVKKSAKKVVKAKPAKSAKTAKSNGSGKRTPRADSKTQGIRALLARVSGCTVAQVLAFTGWKAVSMPQMAKNLRVKLIKSDDRPAVYRAK